MNLKRLLQGYDEQLTKYLGDVLHQGLVSILTATLLVKLEKNAQSVLIRQDAIWPNTESELMAGRYKGPYTTLPFDNMYISTLGTCPKCTPGSHRLIQDLSYSYDGLRSVNDGISQTNLTVHYHTVADAVELILHFGKGFYLSKSGIPTAFRIIPVHPDDHHKLGFIFDGEICYDMCLLMGIASSPLPFNGF